jgi:hypothetical protein
LRFLPCECCWRRLQRDVWLFCGITIVTSLHVYNNRGNCCRKHKASENAAHNGANVGAIVVLLSSIVGTDNTIVSNMVMETLVVPSSNDVVTPFVDPNVDMSGDGAKGDDANDGIGVIDPKVEYGRKRCLCHRCRRRTSSGQRCHRWCWSRCHRWCWRRCHST